MVSQPGEYPWSSYLCHAEGEPDLLVNDHELFTRLGRNVDARHTAYRALFQSTLEETTLEEIRAATNKGWALGDGTFKERMLMSTSRRLTPLSRGRPRKLTAESSLEEILNIIK